MRDFKLFISVLLCNDSFEVFLKTFWTRSLKTYLSFGFCCHMFGCIKNKLRKCYCSFIAEWFFYSIIHIHTSYKIIAMKALWKLECPLSVRSFVCLFGDKQTNNWRQTLIMNFWEKRWGRGGEGIVNRDCDVSCNCNDPVSPSQCVILTFVRIDALSYFYSSKLMLFGW